MGPFASFNPAGQRATRPQRGRGVAVRRISPYPSAEASSFFSFQLVLNGFSLSFFDFFSSSGLPRNDPAPGSSFHDDGLINLTRFSLIQVQYCTKTFFMFSFPFIAVWPLSLPFELEISFSSFHSRALSPFEIFRTLALSFCLSHLRSLDCSLILSPFLFRPAAAGGSKG